MSVLQDPLIALLSPWQIFVSPLKGIRLVEEEEEVAAVVEEVAVASSDSEYLISISNVLDKSVWRKDMVMTFSVNPSQTAWRNGPKVRLKQD